VPFVATPFPPVPPKTRLCNQPKPSSNRLNIRVGRVWPLPRIEAGPVAADKALLDVEAAWRADPSALLRTNARRRTSAHVRGPDQ
jgi:hypothetical protein